MAERSLSKGPSQRQQRVAELIRHTLAEIITRGEIHSPELFRFMPSFNEVRMSPDLRLATIYVSSLGRKADTELLDVLKKHQKEIRHLVARRVNLRYAPDLRFRLDDTLDEVQKIEALLHSEKVRRDLEKREDEEEDPEQSSA